MNKFVWLSLFVCHSFFLFGQKKAIYTSPKNIDRILSYQPNRTIPLILAHRGGPTATQTENSLETFEATNRQAPDAIIEMDVRMTADSALILLHDDQIERATTGKGSVKEMTWAELKLVQLRDLSGKATPQRVPLFDDILRWGAGKVLMAIDAKPGVDLRKVMRAIEAHKGLHSVFIICYSTEDAIALRKQYPNTWIALGFNQPDHARELRQAGLSLTHLIALASPHEKAFYDQIHQDGIICTAGTYGPNNPDERPVQEVAEEYRRLFRTGADMLTTDRPVEVRALFK